MTRKRKPHQSTGTAWPHCTAKAATPDGQLFHGETVERWVGWCLRCGWTTVTEHAWSIDAMAQARHLHGDCRCVAPH